MMMLQKIDDDSLLHGLPVASKRNIFPMIPDTDSFLLVPKGNDDDCGGAIKNDDHDPLMIKDDDKVVRRFSTGDVTVPYTNVGILSTYLAAASKGSYHNYSRYGMRDEETDLEKMFNDTLGKEQHPDMLWSTAATLMERRKNNNKKSMSGPIHVTTPSSCVGISKIDPPSYSGGTLYPKDNGHSPSRSEIGVAVTSKPQRHGYSSAWRRVDAASTSTRSMNPSLSKLRQPPSSSSASQLGVEIHRSSSQISRRRSVSVSRVERPSSSANKFSILSKANTSSSSEVGISSALYNPRPKKLAPNSSSVKDIEASTHHSSLRRSSLLQKCSGAKDDRKVQIARKMPSSAGGRFITENRTEQRRLEVVKPAKKHEFSRRQTASDHVNSSSPKRATRVSSGEKGDNHKKSVYHVKQAEAYHDDKEVVKAKITAEKSSVPLVYSSFSPSKNEPNKNTQSRSPASTMKVLKRAKHAQEYKNLRRTRARSVKSEPMGGVKQSKDLHSVISSTESCETDYVFERRSMERIQGPRSGTTTTTTSTTRRTSTMHGALSIGDQQKQPKKLKARPARVVEFKYEITSPRKLMFKRKTPRHFDNSSSTLAKVDIQYEVLRKAETIFENGGNELTEADVDVDADAEEARLRQEEKIISDRKSKVKDLVGAFESLNSM
ncbi:hypothetical protein LINPERPRIM_LOCUS28617 [Linum perenne]